MRECTAYVDESYREHDTAGFYVLAAAIFESGQGEAREAMLDLRDGKRIDKVHWHEMGPKVQLRAAEAVRRLAGIHLVTLGSPVHHRRQERARRASLRRLVFELHALGVTRVLIEARQTVLD